jgi:molybdenum cofactor cytidylyltransferase
MIVALVPAAGSSKRMGHPKLLVEIDGQPVIGRVVHALRAGGVGRVVVIAPPADAPEGQAIAKAASAAGAEVVVPSTRPAEMRESIEHGLELLDRPKSPEGVMVTPADHPGIMPEIVDQIAQYAARYPESLVIPTYNGRRGHPIVLPWKVAVAVHSLPEGMGLNALVAEHSDLVAELATSHPEIVRDLDTPDDLAYWQNRHNADRNLATKMKVTVRLFALAKERAGGSELTIELSPGSTVADLRTALADRLPTLAPLMSSTLIAVDEEYASDGTAISPGSRLAVIPPVSGGCGDRSLSGYARQIAEVHSLDD